MTQKNEAIEKVTVGALVAPDFITSDGAEAPGQFDRSEIVLPRLALAQALSPELDESDPKYIEGLKNGDAFNSLSRDIYGKAPLNVVVVSVLKPRFIEFDPKQRGVIVDFDVPANDPRTQFTTGDNGARVKPVATQFMEFVALVNGEPVMLSFKGAGLKTARDLKSLIELKLRLQKKPDYSRYFVLTPTVKKNDKGTFSVFAVALGGFIEDPELFKTAADLAKGLREQTVTIQVDRETDGDHATADKDVPF